MQDQYIAWITAGAAVLGPFGIWLFRWFERKDGRDDRKEDWRSRQESNLFDRQDKQLERCYVRVNALEEDLYDAINELEYARENSWRWYGISSRLHAQLTHALAGRDDTEVVPPLPPFKENRNA